MNIITLFCNIGDFFLAYEKTCIMLRTYLFLQTNHLENGKCWVSHTHITNKFFTSIFVYLWYPFRSKPVYHGDFL